MKAYLQDHQIHRTLYYTRNTLEIQKIQSFFYSRLTLIQKSSEFKTFSKNKYKTNPSELEVIFHVSISEKNHFFIYFLIYSFSFIFVEI